MNSPKKRVAVLGSTGSIGVSTLDVIARHRDRFDVFALTASTSVEAMAVQCMQYKPVYAVMASEPHGRQLESLCKTSGLQTRVLWGRSAIEMVAEHENVDVVMAAIVGAAGLAACLSAARAGKRLLLANKEALVVGGQMFMDAVAAGGATLLPIDSEHSAIFQCLEGEKPNKVEKIILTGSGGPFRGMSLERLQNVKPEDALHHPTWNMGPKISVDSATLMNKGLEVIEARWLFHLNPNQIEVIIHPQSVIHSMVQFVDGSIKAQMSIPDMRLPIQYALSYPERLPSSFQRFDFIRNSPLTFEAPNTHVFRNLILAFEALHQGGNMPCILNAANEIAVEAFLQHRIPFLRMPVIIEKCMNMIDFISSPDLSQLIETDRITREVAQGFL